VLNIPKGLHHWLFGRVLTGWLGDIVFFFALAFTSFSKANSIFFTNTLMIPFMARIMLSEKIYWVNLLVVCIGFIGMLLSVIPYKDFPSLFEALKLDNTIQKPLIDQTTFYLDVFGMVLAFLGAIISALTVIFIRKTS
jgi:drug/metabolite transporter (DMT)-like permease